MAALSPLLVLVTVVSLTLPWLLEVHAQQFCRRFIVCNDDQTWKCFNAAGQTREYQCRRPADCGDGEPACFVRLSNCYNLFYDKLLMIQSS